VFFIVAVIACPLVFAAGLIGALSTWFVHRRQRQSG